MSGQIGVPSNCIVLAEVIIGFKLIMLNFDLERPVFLCHILWTGESRSPLVTLLWMCLWELPWDRSLNFGGGLLWFLAPIFR